jgi:hypothetical protein
LVPLLSKWGAVIIVIKRELNLVLSQKVMLMNKQNCLTSACRYCRFYRPEGMHGGSCQQLGVAVRSDWKACQLALPAFANAWENAEELTTANRQVELPQVLHSQELNSAVGLELSETSLLGANN